MDNHDLAEIWAYHDGTKHSVESVYRSGHHLEWAIMPRPFKVYPDLERSEEHTSELQSPVQLVCRLLLEKKKVKEIMIPRTQVVALEETATYEEALKLVTESELSRIPVYRGSLDEVVGVLHAKTLLADVKKGIQPEEFQLTKYVRKPFFVPEVMKVSRLLTEMQRRKTHLAIVVDEFGGTSGIVTLEDVVEEIVGEIHDESDVEEKRIKILSDGVVLADAQVSIRDLEEHLGVEFPEGGDYETLGGFLTATAGRVPPTGSLVVWGGLTFTVKAADDRRVQKVEIARKPAAGSAVTGSQHSGPEKQPAALQTPVPPDQVH